MDDRPETPPFTNKPVDIAPWEKAVGKLVNIANLSCTLPVKFSFSTGVIYVSKSKLKRCIWLLRLVWLTLDSVYLLIISPQVKLASVGEKEFLGFWTHTVSRLVACIISWAVAIDLQANTTLFNAIMTTRRMWKKKFGLWGEDFQGPQERSLRRVFQFCTIFFSIQAIFPINMHLNARQSARYWGSQLLSSEIYNSVPGMVLAAANEFLLAQVAITNCGYGTELIVSFFVIMRFYATSIISKVKNKSLTSERQIPLLQYRSLLTLNRINNASCGHTVVPAILLTSLGMNAVVLSVLIKMGNRMPFSIVLNFILSVTLMFIGMSLTFGCGGHMLTRSQELKRMLLGEEKNIYRRKFLIACQDMRMHVGQFYYVKSSTFINCIGWTFDQAITIVFAF
ncbi:unnamed protein product [Orchesella dallaii]|uniref:Odorant receptor n=1 Tax=Orchesella dallaii TaxID=48710 RepID=A0ABP1RDP1_9HEXA